MFVRYHSDRQCSQRASCLVSAVSLTKNRLSLCQWKQKENLKGKPLHSGATNAVNLERVRNGTEGQREGRIGGEKVSHLSF